MNFTTERVSAVRRVLARGVHKSAGWIAPKGGGAQNRAVYYSQQPSCQIPNLWFLYSKFLGDRDHGSFVEIGAFDGIFVSNTWGLAERNWRGLLVEPIPQFAEACRRNHSAHPAVSVVETAVGGTGRSHLTLRLAGTLTTANHAVLQEYAETDWASISLTDREFVVPCVTAAELLAEHAIDPDFDVLVVDVEGQEREVFSTLDLDRWRPKMMIVELADTHPDLKATASDDARLYSEFATHGYVVVFKDSVNTVFVRDDVWVTSLGASSS